LRDEYRLGTIWNGDCSSFINLPIDCLLKH